MKSSTFFSYNKKSLLYLIFLILVPLLFSSAATYYLSVNQSTFEGLKPFQWLFFYLITVLTMAFALTPTTFIALLSGFYLGWAGAAAVIPAYIASSVLGFIMAGFIDQGKLLRSVSGNPKVTDFISNLKEKEFPFIVVSRLSPVLPFALMNFVLSAMKVRFLNFMLAGAIGMVPRTLLFIWTGSQARNLLDVYRQTGELDIINLITIGLIVVTILGMIYLLVTALRKSRKNINS